MARGLNRHRPAKEPRSRRTAFVTVVAVVALLHLIVTHEVAAELADFNAANAMPARIQVAYVRTLEPEAPKAAAPLAVPKVAAAPARPRAAHRPARAASAAEPVVAQALAPPGTASDSASAPEAALAAASAASDAASPASAALVAASAASAVAAPVAAATPPDAAASGTFTWPTATRVSYDVSGNYRGPIDGKAEVEWIRVDEHYQVNVDLFAGPQFAPIFSRHMMSEGTVAVGGLTPDHYNEETQFLARDKRRVSVTFAPDSVQLADGQKRDRMPGVQDTASQFIQFTWLFGSKPEALRVGASFEFPLALPRSMKRWTYDVVGEDTLYTPFGVLPAYHLKPRIVERKPGELTVEMWFAPELRYLPVRIRIEQDAGTFVDLMISKKPEIAAS
jgi:hypothetical protein